MRYDEPPFATRDAVLLNFQRKLHKALWIVHAHLHVLERERLDTAPLAELRATAALLRDAMAALVAFHNRKRDAARHEAALAAASTNASNSASISDTTGGKSDGNSGSGGGNSNDGDDDLPKGSVMRVGPQRVSVPQAQRVHVTRVAVPQQALTVELVSAPQAQRAQTVEVHRTPQPQRATVESVEEVRQATDYGSKSLDSLLDMIPE